MFPFANKEELSSILSCDSYKWFWNVNWTCGLHETFCLKWRIRLLNLVHLQIIIQQNRFIGLMIWPLLILAHFGFVARTRFGSICFFRWVIRHVKLAKILNCWNIVADTFVNCREWREHLPLIIVPVLKYARCDNSVKAVYFAGELRLWLITESRAIWMYTCK